MSRREQKRFEKEYLTWVNELSHSGSRARRRRFHWTTMEMDGEANESIALSGIHGLESVSHSSLIHLRSKSYLQGCEATDCIERLLGTIAEEPQPPPPPPLPPQPSLPPGPTAPLATATREGALSIKSRLLARISQTFGSPDKWLRSIDVQSGGYLLWLALVSLVLVYNIVSVSLRYAFGYECKRALYHELKNNNNNTNSSNSNNTAAYHAAELMRLLLLASNRATNRVGGITSASAAVTEVARALKCDQVIDSPLFTNVYWDLFDYAADLIHLADVFLVQTRITFLSRDGLWVSDVRSTATHYFKSSTFVMDMVAIVPLHLAQLVTGTFMPLLRLNRCLRLRSLWEFFDRWDRSVQSYIFLIRLMRLFTYLQIVIHLYACAYYKMSFWETTFMRIHNEWTYVPETSKIHFYVFAYFFGLKTASTIGSNPQPITKYEYLFTAVSYVLALFLFALIVGQIRSIIASLTTKHDNFLILLNETSSYIQRLNLPDYLLAKIKLWFDFYAHEQDAISLEAISFLPLNLQTELAIAIYYDLLSKVKLFKDCERNLLNSLVLKLKPKIFMPGDYICQKGDVGREMFIVEKGVVEVIVNGKAVAQMKEGSYFGEVALLDEGANRRTANVISQGFSRLLVLQKSDLKEVLLNYPGMEDTLRNVKYK